MTDPARVAERHVQLHAATKAELSAALRAQNQRLQELERLLGLARIYVRSGSQNTQLVKSIDRALSTPEAEPRCDFGSCTQPQGHVDRHIFESEAHTP